MKRTANLSLFLVLALTAQTACAQEEEPNNIGGFILVAGIAVLAVVVSVGGVVKTGKQAAKKKKEGKDTAAEKKAGKDKKEDGEKNKRRTWSGM